MGNDWLTVWAGTGRVDLPPPAGAFYAFLKVYGIEDSRNLAMRLVDEANIGLASGSTFGLGGESYLRLCFARKSEDLEEAVNRLEEGAVPDRDVTPFLIVFCSNAHETDVPSIGARR